MKAYALPASILILAVAVLASVFLFNSQSAIGSVIMGGEYDATQLTTGTTTLATLPATFGHVIVTDSSSAAGFLDVYATSSNATNSADRVLRIDLQAAEGTYVFDAAFGKGLLIDVDTSFDGSVVVTHRR